MDHICVKRVHWRKRGEEWEKTREYWLFDFHRLPDRQWSARRLVMMDYGDPEKGIHRSEAHRTVDVKVLKEDEFPQESFDGEKLLEGAKVETY